MATYYVRPDGNDSNTGLGSTAALAWQTFGKAFASGSVVVGGDTVYIAPGTYTENITIAATSPSSEVNIIGDPTASQFSGVNPGFVRLSSFNAAGTLAAFSNTHVIKGTSKNNYTFQNIHFDGNFTSNNQAAVYFVTSRYIKFIKCLFTNNANSVFELNAMLWLEAPAATAGDFLVDRCIFGANRANHITFSGKSISTDTSIIKDSLFISGRVILSAVTAGVYNCTFVGSPDAALAQISGSANAFVTVQNCLFLNNLQALNGTSGFNSQTYCRFAGNNTSLINFASSATSQTTGNGGVDIGYTQLNGLNVLPLFASYASSPNASFGNATGAPLVDLYNKSWSGTSPDAGAVTLSPITGAGYYLPTERNASAITIAPGSTSQSIELYLGVTGLTASTSGLSAYYNRTRSADVQIPLVARTIGQAWTSGGFAEVNASTMPGVYRLDIPNEALAAGADDVTVVVRGASGTNGAVISIKLSSGGLTTAQTATAVWGALTSDHTTHGTYGWNVLRADQTSKQGLVGLHTSNNINRVDADVHAIVNDTTAATYLKGALNHDGTGYVDSDVVRVSTSTAAADELEGALLHNGTDYIDSNLLSENSTRVFVGRFQLKQTGSEQVDIIEAFTTDTPSFELQLFDGDNNIVPVTGATLGLRILDVTSTVVETGTPTIEYGAGGIVRWTAPGSYVSIGCPAGNYRLFIDRTVSGTTTTFGPLQIKVQVQ
jgi:hypothetical protein